MHVHLSNMHSYMVVIESFVVLLKIKHMNFSHGLVTTLNVFCIFLMLQQCLCQLRSGAYTHTHTHTHTHTNTHAHTQTHTRMHRCTHSHTYTHMHSHTYTHARTHARTNTHSHTQTHTHIHTWFLEIGFVCNIGMHVCTCVCQISILSKVELANSTGTTTFQSLMLLAVAIYIMDGYGFSNKTQ